VKDITAQAEQCIYYSTTRTNQKILDKIAEGTGLTEITPIDLTNAKEAKTTSYPSQISQFINGMGQERKEPTLII